MEFLLIGDSRIEAVLVRDNGEALVDLAKSFPELSFDFTRKYVQKISPSISFGRESVGRKLTEAQRLLPRGCKFLIKECYRPLAVQHEFWTTHEEFLRNKFPSWDIAQIREECSKYAAPVTVAPHCTGGAVDLLLTDLEGRWLEMGSRFNAEPSECEYRTYFSSNKISEEARANREILSSAMTAVGFINYPTEWWHWSYGDKYWAHQTSVDAAIYAII